MGSGVQENEIKFSDAIIKISPMQAWEGEAQEIYLNTAVKTADFWA